MRQALAILIALILASCANNPDALLNQPDPIAEAASEEIIPTGNFFRGEMIFHKGIGDAPPCIACHALTPKTFSPGPGMAKIAENAATRIAGMSAEAYLRQSILDPAAYIVPCYRPTMYLHYAEYLSEQDVNDLVTFLMNHASIDNLGVLKMDIELFLDTYGMAAIFGIMLIKSIGVPIPIPADVLMLATSARVATGKLDLLTAFIALLVALSVGGTIQFVLVKGVGRGLLVRYGRYLGITPARLETVSRRLEKGGVLGIGIAILTPGIRSVTVPACGMAGISLSRFAPGLTLGSGAFLALHFLIGLLGGSLLAQTSLSISPLALAESSWYFWQSGSAFGIGFGGGSAPNDSPREIMAAAAGAWHEATCPVCLALGAAQRLQIDLPNLHVHDETGQKAHVH